MNPPEENAMCPIRRCLPLLLLLLFVPAAPTSAGTPPARNTESREGWPATAPGALGRGWVSAFSAGEDSMRVFLRAHLTPRSLETRSMSARIESYRGLREKYGKLSFASVVKSGPEELSVKLVDSDGAVHEFVFRASKDQPDRLQSIAIREPGHFMHGFGGHGGQ